MQDWSITKFEPQHKALWNRLNKNARNSTFLTDRDFMDYHSDRFQDYSLIAFKGEKPLALLPANLTSDNVLHSHQGLTYGGWILPRKHFDCVDMMSLWNTFISYCKQHNIRKVDYKPIPYIYHSAPSGEDIYALFRSRAVLSECNISACIKLNNNPGFNEMRRRMLKKNQHKEIIFEKATSLADYTEYYTILSDCLSSRHNAAPVHSLEEMWLLATRFPNNIALWVARNDGKIQAGCWLFVSEKVVHTQYIASTPIARLENILTSLFAILIEHASIGLFGQNIEYFDFGTSNEDGGLILNDNLYRQKASMGASGFPYLRYSLSL